MNPQKRKTTRPISQDEIAEIRRLEADAWSLSAIARKVGRSRGTVARYSLYYLPPADCDNGDGRGWLPSLDEIEAGKLRIRAARRQVVVDVRSLTGTEPP